MKVIRSALEEEHKSKRIKCQHCDSELEITSADVSFVFDQRDGDYAVLQCPCCHRQINIQASLLPKGWRMSSR